MPELNRESFLALWQAAKVGQMSEDSDMALMQKIMMMHDELHELFDCAAGDHSVSLELGGENVMLRLAMESAVHRSLETDQPSGARALMQSMLDDGMHPARAYDVMTQAMMHSFIAATNDSREMTPEEYLHRAHAYAAQASTQKKTT